MEKPIHVRYKLVFPEYGIVSIVFILFVILPQ